MRPIWLLEANVTGLPTDQLQMEIRRQGMDVQAIKYLPHVGRPGDIAGSERVPHDACAIFMGTLPLMQYIRQERRWRPGGFCNVSNLACSTYYAYFGEFLLNQRYAMLPVAEVLRHSDALLQTFGRGGDIFLRPDSVEKTFAGTLVDSDSLPRLVAPITYDPTTMIIVAEPRAIDREWRLVIRSDEVLTASQYRTSAGSLPVADCPAFVIEFAQHVLREVSWRPDPIFIMDIGETPNGLRVTELNSFSCSGPYLCDLSIMVRVASQIAEGS